MLLADCKSFAAATRVKWHGLVTEFGKVYDRRNLKVGKSKVMKSTRKDMNGKIEAELNGEVLKKGESVSCIGATIAANEEVKLYIRKY